MSFTFAEIIQGNAFENYQVNGTKYIKNSRALPHNIQDHLEQCAGEIFLSGIPQETTAAEIASIASILGEIYLLRFKVNFAAQSRGFAYLQYIDPGIMNFAILRLSELFKHHGLGQIRVRQSKNTSKLVLRNVFEMTPQAVEETLRKYVNFRYITARCIRANKFEFQIVFGSNEDAVQARRSIIHNISSFGRSAMVTWDRTDEAA